jgi:hypothetical protein
MQQDRGPIANRPMLVNFRLLLMLRFENARLGLKGRLVSALLVAHTSFWHGNTAPGVWPMLQ